MLSVIQMLPMVIAKALDKLGLWFRKPEGLALGASIVNRVLQK